MSFTRNTPCPDCPFLVSNAQHYREGRLEQFASGRFPCHKSAALVDDEEGTSEFVATKDSLECTGSLLFQLKRGTPNQMTRIAMRLGMFDPDKLSGEVA